MVNTKTTPRKQNMSDNRLICPVCKLNVPRNQTFEQYAVACTSDKVGKLSQCSVCKVTFIKDEYRRRHMKREHGMAEAEAAQSSDWDSDPEVEIGDPCSRKRSMPRPIPAPTKKKPFPAPVRKPAPTATVQSNKPVPTPEEGKAVTKMVPEKEQPQGSEAITNTGRVVRIAHKAREFKTQGAQTEKPQETGIQKEDRGMQTDSADNSNEEGKKSSCGFCEIDFSHNLMSCMHQGVHSVDNPLRCNICGYLCQDKLEFFSHLTWGHKK